MRFNRLDLNLLVALDALLDEKKTTAAAQRLSVSQSAISGMLARLRVYFEDDLLVQVGRQMELTPLGRDLADPVRQLILQIQATVAIRPALSIATERRNFKITVSDYTVPILIAPLVRRLQALAPCITITLLPQIENTGLALRRGETDLTIVPDGYLDADHPHLLLFEDSYSCVVWDGNTEVGATLDLATFARCGHVAPHLGRPGAPTVAERHLAASGVTRSIAVTTHDFTSQATLVVGTQLITTMQTRLAHDSAARLPLRVLAVPVAMPTLRVCMQWHDYQSADPAHRWLREQLVAVAQPA
ncbi:LysR family transcriptional regulator [Massilia sp. S19_KUP03_FR1]|uniref:LysR family transcriptional regulator n=1 Tax=Massilia sp. S19_KUP03_FR1 TaxID=3025503 RepID=UPI002FCD2AE9